jgi:hypothetical protein
MSTIRGMHSVRLSLQPISIFTHLNVESAVLGIVETDAWLKELMVTVDDRKGHVERYIELLFKESKYINLLNSFKWTLSKYGRHAR